MTTHVRVMYMLDKHVHALNLLDINIDRSNFLEHVRVGRLILKKIFMDSQVLKILDYLPNKSVRSSAFTLIRKRYSQNGSLLGLSVLISLSAINTSPFA